MAEREGFLARWARLKGGEREASAAAAQEAAPVNPPPATPDLTAEPVAASAEVPADPNADLPPIDSLDRYSDYTAFMRAGVAPELRKQALAKLWRSDPVFANLDGLLEYGEDYFLRFKTPPLVATLYQVGKGMVAPAVQESPAVETASSEETRQPLDTPEIASAPGDSADAKKDPGEVPDVADPSTDHRA